MLNFLLSKSTNFLYSRSRPELHYSALVVVAYVLFVVAMGGLVIAFNLFGSPHILNMEFLGYMFGSLGVGELARAFFKINISRYINKPFIAENSFAGAFWVCMVLKWGHEFWTIPIGFLSGILVYNAFALAYKFDVWFYSRS